MIAVDPNDPDDVVIADIKLAPRHAEGLVEVTPELFILRRAGAATIRCCLSCQTAAAG